MDVLGGGAVSYERGTPVGRPPRVDRDIDCIWGIWGEAWQHVTASLESAACARLARECRMWQLRSRVQHHRPNVLRRCVPKRGLEEAQRTCALIRGWEGAGGRCVGVEVLVLQGLHAKEYMYRVAMFVWIRIKRTFLSGAGKPPHSVPLCG